MIWKPISELPPYNDRTGDDQRFIVWNGKDSGEAYRKLNYDWGDDGNDAHTVVWAWSHRSTCGCCFSEMCQPPILYMEMPVPEQDND